MFKSKGTVFSTKFVRRTPVMLELMVRDIGFLVIRVDVKATVEVEVDVSLFVYMNCFFNFGCIVQYTVLFFL